MFQDMWWRSTTYGSCSETRGSLWWPSLLETQSQVCALQHPRMPTTYSPSCTSPCTCRLLDEHLQGFGCVLCVLRRRSANVHAQDFDFTGPWWQSVPCRIQEYQDEAVQHASVCPHMRQDRLRHEYLPSCGRVLEDVRRWATNVETKCVDAGLLRWCRVPGGF